MAKFQIQSRSAGSIGWTDEPTCVYSRRDCNIAIAGAKLVIAEAQLFGRRKRVRIMRKRWLWGTDSVWESSDC